MERKKNLFVITSLLLLLLLFVLIAVNTNGTFDSGDSIMHFLYSKYAFKYPEFFLHHWGKPLFILLSSPFSQFGFTGMKVFNCLIGILTAWFVYLTSQRIEIKSSYLSIILLIFAPQYFLALFSGLTEPLFGLFLIFSIYLFIKGKFILSLTIVSFMPFIRSEGLIIILVFLTLLIITKRFKFIPLLITGNFFYAIIGGTYFKDFLWVIHQNPYKGRDVYGSGSLFHFVTQLPFVIGIPLYILLILGLLFIFLAVFYPRFRNKSNFFIDEFLLIYGCFFAYFIAH